MKTALPESETQTSATGSREASGQILSDQSERRMHQFQPGLGDHPLWQALMDEMELNRQADIAEANRLADLELAK